jgi:hypothetical protein
VAQKTSEKKRGIKKYKELTFTQNSEDFVSKENERIATYQYSKFKA